MSDKNDPLIEMQMVGIFMDPATQAPVILLKTAEGERQLPIWIGMTEATSIAAYLKKLVLSRPLTHDIFATMIKELGGVVEQVVINDLKDSTYYAEIIVSQGEKILIIDSRPSDAVALAVRTGAAIFVTEKVLKTAEATVPAPKVVLPAAPEGEEETLENTELDDLRYIDKSKWEQILKELENDDFKYKA